MNTKTCADVMAICARRLDGARRRIDYIALGRAVAAMTEKMAGDTAESIADEVMGAMK
jgi:hypothetical protein